MKCSWITKVNVVVLSLWVMMTLGNGQKFKATQEITERLKKAYAYYCQGQYEQALNSALPIYQKDPDIWVAWWPKWVYRVVKGPIPDPYQKSEIMRLTVKSYEEGRSLNLSAYRKTANARQLVADSYFALGRFQEALPIYEEIEQLFGKGPALLPGKSRMCRRYIAQGYRPPQPPPKNTWRPLPLRFREEDYFILVPLEEACKVLGLGCSIAPNTKVAGGKGIRVTKPDAPNITWRLFLGHPIVERLENGKGHTEGIAYAPFEEDGKVWVPFYWLARQAGIRGWEVRNGKIYVTPKQGTK